MDLFISEAECRQWRQAQGIILSDSTVSIFLWPPNLRTMATRGEKLPVAGKAAKDGRRVTWGPPNCNATGLQCLHPRWLVCDKNTESVCVSVWDRNKLVKKRGTYLNVQEKKNTYLNSKHF